MYLKVQLLIKTTHRLYCNIQKLSKHFEYPFTARQVLQGNRFSMPTPTGSYHRVHSISRLMNDAHQGTNVARSACATAARVTQLAACARKIEAPALIANLPKVCQRRARLVITGNLSPRRRPTSSGTQAAIVTAVSSQHIQPL